MTRPIAVGLIGCGGISAAHSQAYRSLGPQQVQVVVTCDENQELAAKRASELGSQSWLTDWREVIDRQDIHAVDICLPHDLHSPVAVAAATRGKHVLVEKPLARTLSEADTMITAARQAGVILMCGFCERYDPQHQIMKEFVDKGFLGKPLLARIDHNQHVTLPPDHWIRSASRLGGGVIASAGCHRIDLLRWFFGEIVAVSAFTAHSKERMEGEIAGVVNFLFANGAVGNLTITWVAHDAPHYERVWLEGADGSIHNYHGLQSFSRLRPKGAGSPIAHEVPPGDPFANQISHFLHCIRTGSVPLTSGEDAGLTLEVALAAYESERTGRVINPVDL